MSPKPDAIKASAGANIAESPMIDTGSCNEWSVNPTESDSESDSDDLESRELGLLREQTAEGLAAIIERFWSKVQKSDGCWLWTASRMDRYGHGQFTVRDAARRQHHLYAHRVAWALAGFEIAPHLKLCHRCDVALCVNPAHLFIGTQQDNLNDARQKRRLIDGLHLRKLTDADMATIRATYRRRINGKQLAAHYGIHMVTLLRVVRGTARVDHRSLRNVEPVSASDAAEMLAAFRVHTVESAALHSFGVVR